MFKVDPNSHYEADLDFEKASIETRWEQADHLVKETYIDYLMIMRATKDFMKHMTDEVLESMQAKLQTTIKKAPQQVDPFRLDEMAMSMDSFAKTGKPSLLAIFVLPSSEWRCSC